MQWRNHKIVTFSVVYAATGSFVPSLCAMSGSVLPDVLEIGGLLPHRTITHWPYPYMAALATVYMINSYSSHFWPYILFFLILGYLMHLLEDFMSISGLPFGKTPDAWYYGLGIYRTKSASEEFTALGLTAAFLFLAWSRGFFTSEHFGHQASQIVGFGKYIAGRL